MSRVRLLTLVIPLLAGLLVAGCGGDAPEAEAPTTTTSSSASAPSAAPSAPSAAASAGAPAPASGTGGLAAFAGDPVAHAGAAIAVFEAGAARKEVKTRKIKVVLVDGKKACTSKKPEFSGTDTNGKVLELCVKDRPFTIALNKSLYASGAQALPNELIALLLQRWAVGVVELNGSNRNMLAAGCVAGATLAGAKDTLSAEEFTDIVTWSAAIPGEYGTGFGDAHENVWETCKLIGIVK